VRKKAVRVTPGYSDKSLAAKLGVKPGQRLLAIDAPAHYAKLIAPLPESARLALGSWGRSESGAEIVHAFFRRREDLAEHLTDLVRLPASGGMIWVSWPKKSSSLFRDLTDNVVRTLLLPTGWVDVKVVAVDVDWSGLKFLTRAADRARPVSR
jgi:hypothetical protein